jgi:hypothetical protein
MNVNGRLTAPPHDEVASVTNSVYGISFEGGGFTPRTSGTPLDNFAFGIGSPLRYVRADGRGIGWMDPVSVTQYLSVPGGAAARG